MSVSEGAEYSMGVRVTVAMVVVLVVVVMIGSVVVSGGGTVAAVGMIMVMVVGLVYRVAFLAVCRLGRVQHTCSHGN